MKHYPKDFVKVSLFGLKYRGRVVRCILEDLSAPWLFDVQYANNTGELLRGEFHGDELEPCSPDGT